MYRGTLPRGSSRKTRQYIAECFAKNVSDYMFVVVLTVCSRVPSPPVLIVLLVLPVLPGGHYAQVARICVGVISSFIFHH